MKPSTLRVRATDIATTTGRSALVESQGSWSGAPFGPNQESDGARSHTYNLIDSPGWRIIGRGQVVGSEQPFIGADTFNPCKGQLLTAQFADPYPALAPTNVLRGGEHNGTWKSSSTTHEFATRFIGRELETWNDQDVEVTQVRMELQNLQGSIHTQIDIWSAAELDAVLRASRWTNRSAQGSTPMDVYAQPELREYKANSEVPEIIVATRDQKAPSLPDLAVGFSGEPINLTVPNATETFWLVQTPGRTRWQLDPDTMRIEWRLIGGYHVAHQSSEAEPMLRFSDLGPYWLTARIYPKTCTPDPSPTSLSSIGELARISWRVPTYWEMTWNVNVPAGAQQDIVLDEWEFNNRPSRIVAFVERVGVSNGPSTDDGRVVLRTPVNNDFALPSEDLPPGTYRVVWRAQGAAGAAVVGDDWVVTLQVQYFD